jgi:hypothetical protein
MSVFFIWAGISASCMATTPRPFEAQREFLDRIATAADSQPAAALEVLEFLSLGEVPRVSVESCTRIGIAMKDLEQQELRQPSIRAYAFTKIGEIGGSSALEFLTSLTPGDIGADPTGEIWPACRLAIQRLLLNQIADSQSKILFLERVISEPHDAAAGDAIQSWAVNELCDRGSLASLPAIKHSIRSRDSSQRGEEEFEFCAKRIAVLLRDPDRSNALGTVLITGKAHEDARLTMWAIARLEAEHSQMGYSELERFRAEIEEMPQRSPLTPSYLYFKNEIDRWINTRKGQTRRTR